MSCTPSRGLMNRGFVKHKTLNISKSEAYFKTLRNLSIQRSSRYALASNITSLYWSRHEFSNMFSKRCRSSSDGGNKFSMTTAWRTHLVCLLLKFVDDKTTSSFTKVSSVMSLHSFTIISSLFLSPVLIFFCFFWRFFGVLCFPCYNNIIGFSNLHISFVAAVYKFRKHAMHIETSQKSFYFVPPQMVISHDYHYFHA